MGTKTRKVSAVQKSADFGLFRVRKKEDVSVVVGEYPLIHKVDGMWTRGNDPDGEAGKSAQGGRKCSENSAKGTDIKRISDLYTGTILTRCRNRERPEDFERTEDLTPV